MSSICGVTDSKPPVASPAPWIWPRVSIGWEAPKADLILGGWQAKKGPGEFRVKPEVSRRFM